MRNNGLLVVCKTDAENCCMAVFQVSDRKQATTLRKLLYSILSANCHSSVAVWAETKQHYTGRRLAIADRAGLPLPPVRWFEMGDALPERLEDLQVSTEILQAYHEEYREQLRQKPPSYWGLPGDLI